jgi:hypothetical protein
MKVVFKVGDSSATAKPAAGQRTSTARPAPHSLTTPWPKVTSNDDGQGRRFLPPSHHYGYQEDDATVVQDDLRPGQHESLVKRLRERILLEDAAITDGSGHCTAGSKSTLVVLAAIFLVLIHVHVRVY